ncbi:hypothetical protein [Azospirillum brasilense]|uniref:Glycosyltransferase RgtA/B/C/D-like domain-containing protein n=1 Tax=Azospirillum brasilense TaxID=192 RepID=A0A235HB12_AZOBR|nr:hypothetical protein [Azospirillum brasilense]OYD82906.1 hypothetical protein CHT98_18640 [Azospirillum brasilense]
MSTLERGVLLRGVAGGAARSGARVLTALFVVYAVVGLFALDHHEPWRDEAQAWLIARDLPLSDIVFTQMGHEGTPALWHLLNALLISLGLPFSAQAYLNFSFAVGTVGLVFWRAPFSPLVKVLFAFNYYMAYEFSHIARNFALGAFLLALTLSLFGQRRERPMLYAVAVALLANANVFGFLMALGLGMIHAVEALRDRRIGQAVLPALVMAAAGLFAFVQMIPAADNFRTAGAIGMFNMFTPRNLLLANFDLFFGRLDEPVRAFSREWPPARVLLYAMAGFAVLFWGLFLLQIRTSWEALLFFGVVAGGIAYIMVFKKEGSPRVHGHLLLAAIGALWLQAVLHRPSAALRLPGGRSVPAAWLGMGFTAALCAGLAPSVLRAGWNWQKDIRHPFSGAPEMASYLLERGLDRRTIVAYESAWGSAVLPYLDADARFYYPDLRRFGSYLVWTREWAERFQGLPFDEILRSAEADLGGLGGDPEGVLFLMSHPVDDPRVELLHSVAENVERETFHLYRLRKPAP